MFTEENKSERQASALYFLTRDCEEDDNFLSRVVTGGRDMGIPRNHWTETADRPSTNYGFNIWRPKNRGSARQPENEAGHSFSRTFVYNSKNILRQ